MKIKTKILNSFLKKINLNGNINEAVFNFTDKGLEIIQKNIETTVKYKAFLKNSCFENYFSLGKIGVKQISNIVKAVNLFNENVELNVEGNILTLKENNKIIETELANVDSIVEEEYKDLKDNSLIKIDVNPEVFNKIINESSSLNKEFNITLKTAKNSLIIKTTGNFKITENVLVEGLDKETITYWGEPFMTAITNLNGSTSFYLKEEFPMIIREETEESLIDFLVAPRLQN